MVTRLAISGLLVLLSVQAASAFCTRSPGYDFASSVDAELRHLICLHNEQVESLNLHAGMIDTNSENIRRLADELGSLDSALHMLARRIDALEQENALLRATVLELSR